MSGVVSFGASVLATTVFGVLVSDSVVVVDSGGDPGSGVRPGVSAMLMPSGMSWTRSTAVWMGLKVFGGRIVPGCGVA